jgi:hypothetical protein
MTMDTVRFDKLANLPFSVSREPGRPAAAPAILLEFTDFHPSREYSRSPCLHNFCNLARWEPALAA